MLLAAIQMASVLAISEISRFDHTAYALAVYASPCGLLLPIDAILATGDGMLTG